MKPDKQEERRRQIEAAAFELLAEKGYRRTSMLQIAKRAAASNQTLYAWYGNKQNLFQGLIEKNALEVKALLRSALEKERPPLEILRALGPLLLRFTTGEKAIIVNRAAIADAGETGLLAEAIDRAAREEMIGLIEELMKDLIRSGSFRKDIAPAEATETYISLLFGEVQMRQALGRLEPLDESAIEARANRAFSLTWRLYGAEAL